MTKSKALKFIKGAAPIANLLQRKCKCGQHMGQGEECGECKKRSLSLQRHTSGRGAPSSVPGLVHRVIQSPGRPLDQGIRTLMESKFGHDFSRVRVHVDGSAAQSALMLGAQAYTVGQTIVFGDGQYAPNTTNGRRLLAHELTHTIQQRGSLQNSSSELSMTEPNDSSETEAQIAEDAVMRGQSFDSISPTGAQLARQSMDAGRGAAVGASATPVPSSTPATRATTSSASAARATRTIAGDHQACINQADEWQANCQDRGNLLCSVVGARLGSKGAGPEGGAGIYGVCTAIYNRVCRATRSTDVEFCNQKRDCLTAGIAEHKRPSQCGGWWDNWSSGGTGDPWPELASSDTYADWGP
jgi:hypothetical protein